MNNERKIYHDRDITTKSHMCDCPKANPHKNRTDLHVHVYNERVIGINIRTTQSQRRPQTKNIFDSACQRTMTRRTAAKKTSSTLSAGTIAFIVIGVLAALAFVGFGLLRLKRGGGREVTVHQEWHNPRFQPQTDAL